MKEEFNEEVKQDLELSDFMYSVNKLAQKGYAFARKDALFLLGGYYTCVLTSPTAAFRVTTDDPIHKTVEQFYTANLQNISNNWATYMSNAGLT